MNYDLTKIPEGYDRSRDHGSEFIDLWMRALDLHLKGLDVSRILDLGRGTGRFSEALAFFFRAEVVGIDPSLKMLERAREKQVSAKCVSARVNGRWNHRCPPGPPHGCR